MSKLTTRPGMQHAGTILVTGAAGFVGSHLVDLLLREGWKVIGLDSMDHSYNPSRKRANIAPHLRSPAYRFIEADITDLDLLLEAVDEEVHVMVHVAAAPGVREGTSDPGAPLAEDLRGTTSLLEMCRLRRIVQFVFASCGSVYGAAPGLPWGEDVIPLPVSPFAASRLAAEQFGHAYSRLFGIRFVVTRLFNVYGPRDHPNSVVHRMYSALISEGVMPITGDALAQRDFTFVSDAARALRLAMSFGATQFEVFNIGSGVATSMGDMVRELERVSGLRAKTRLVPGFGGELIDCAGSIRKARALLGYTPATTLGAGLHASLQWYLESVEQLRSEAGGSSR